ncbi:solute carrier family 27 member 3 [Phasianus colchicus]|uniref:long-chain-fatty-acid--CoA ligase n=1 Tax=Phasianus colchicus TaxID=9054 RepID=A0A669QBS0_PHACC|nr:solute carrier family 27 member 3 [Phasianus colchicus]
MAPWLALLVALAAAALALRWRRRWAPLCADAAFVVRAARCRRRLLRGGGRSLAARFLEEARKAPRKPFLRLRDGTVRYGEAARTVARMAAALRGRPLPGGGGERLGPRVAVGLLARNGAAFVCAWLALIAVGARPALLGAQLRTAALRHCVRESAARALLVESELFGVVEPIVAELREAGVAVWVMGAGRNPAGAEDLSEALEAAPEELGAEDVWRPPDMGETALYIFTSGTTGLPKAARVSHLKALLCSAFYQLLGADSSDVLYIALPLHHMAGALLGVAGCIGIGASCVLRDKFSASHFWDECCAEGVTVFQYIGELCRYLLNQPQRPAERQHRVRLAVGSGMRADVWRSFVRRFGPLRVVETYGLSEGNVTLLNYSGAPGAVGRSSFIYKLFSPFEIVRYDTESGAALRDEGGRCIRVRPGEPGLLIAPVTPRTPFLGYAGRPELSEQKLLRGVFAEGDTFFSTGDLMEEDSDGFVRFCDRTGDTFRWKGENVATTEVAEALLAHAALQDAAVYGVTVPGHEGRAGMAAVVLRPGWELDGAELFRHVAAALPPYAWPRFIRLQERLALTPTFKQRKALLAQEGCDPSRVAAPLLLLDLPAAAYVPMGPALWDGVVAGRIRL